MIDPKSFISTDSESKNHDSELIDIEGSYGCPENGCYETSYEAKFNERQRLITWVCSNGHPGKASI
jgi:hypothetical protein